VSDRQDILKVAAEEVLRQMPAGVMIVEASSGQTIFVNTEAQQMSERYLGWSVPSELEDLRERHDSRAPTFHPDGRPYESEEWPIARSIRDGEEVRDEEIVNVPAEGTQFTVRCNSSPIYDKEGRIVAGVGVFHDITEQKRVEERDRFQAHLLDAVGQTVVAIDLQGKITYWNRRAEELYSWSAEEVMDRLAGEVLVSEHQDGCGDHRGEALG
jgi:PAS domain S-box-containing protein